MMNYLGLSEPVAFIPHLTALGAAYLLALPIGWNRERAERSAGLRTFPLVAIASCGFIQAAASLTAGNPEAMARIVEGIITGMGFIGGGGDPSPKGLGQRHGDCGEPVVDGRDRHSGRARELRCGDRTVRHDDHHIVAAVAAESGNIRRSGGRAVPDKKPGGAG